MLGSDRLRLFTVGRPRHPVVDAPRQVADLRVQSAAEGDVHLLEAAADPEQRHAAGDAGFDQGQRQIVAFFVIRFVTGMRLDPEPAGMNIGAAAGQQHAIDHLQQRADIGDIGRSGEHHRQGAGNVGHRPEIGLADKLGGEPVFDQPGVADHADHGSLHGYAGLTPASCR